MTRAMGPSCRCGVRRKPVNSTLFVEDDGVCPVHPEKGPQPYGVGAKPSCCDSPNYEVSQQDGEAGRLCKSCSKFFQYGVDVHAWAKVMDVAVLTKLLGKVKVEPEEGSDES